MEPPSPALPMHTPPPCTAQQRESGGVGGGGDSHLSRSFYPSFGVGSWFGRLTCPWLLSWRLLRLTGPRALCDAAGFNWLHVTAACDGGRLGSWLHGLQRSRGFLARLSGCVPYVCFGCCVAVSLAQCRILSTSKRAVLSRRAEKQDRLVGLVRVQYIYFGPVGFSPNTDEVLAEAKGM